MGQRGLPENRNKKKQAMVTGRSSVTRRKTAALVAALAVDALPELAVQSAEAGVVAGAEGSPDCLEKEMAAGGRVGTGEAKKRR